jgi:hypothetical protein
MKLLNILTEHITLPTPTLLTEAESWVKTVPTSDANKRRLVGKGEFGTNVTKDNLSGKFIEKIMETITNDSGPDGLAEWLKSEQLVMTIAKIKSGASNCFGKSGGSEKCNMPVEPTEVNGKGISLSPPPDGGWTGDKAKNLKLAENRGKNLWKELVNVLPQQGLRIAAKPTFTSVIKDTGGVNDDDRDMDKFKNPGQFVHIDVFLEKKESQTQVTSREQSRNCVTKMKVSVVYYDDERSGCKDKNDNKGGCHICNDAKFKVYLNETFIGTANLNNAQKETQEGQTGSGYGGSRKSTFLVSEKSARKITQSKVDMKGNQIPAGSVVLAIQGINQTNQGVHADVPWVILTTGQGEVIYNQLAKGEETWGRGTGEIGDLDVIHNLVGPFNPCKKITT